MNTRQMKKRLKKQINKLQIDNDLMRRIIKQSPEMQELYNVYNKPSHIINTTVEFQQFKAKRMIPVYMADVEEIIEYTKYLVAKDLFEGIKENITYEINEIDSDHRLPSITGSIFVGIK